MFKDEKRNSIFRAILIVVLIIGFIMVATGAAGVFLTNLGAACIEEQVENYVNTDAVVYKVDIRKTGENENTVYVYVRYEVNGEEYISKLDTMNLFLKKGDKVEICYNPDDPSVILDKDIDAVPKVFEYAMVIYLIAGLMFFLVSAVLLIVMAVTVSKRKKNERRYQNVNVRY